MNNKILLALVSLMTVTISCQVLLKTPTSTPITPVSGPTTDLNAQSTQIAQDKSTQAAQSTSDVQMTSQAGQTATAITSATQRALNDAATSTQYAVTNQTATAQVYLEETAQAQGMLNAIQKVSDEAIRANPSGTYYRLKDIDNYLAKIKYISTPYTTGFSPDNFAIRATISWDSGSDIANWDRCGCGFIFAAHADDYYDFIILDLDGYVRLYRPQPGTHAIYPFSEKRYSGVISKPKGEAEIMLISINKRVSFFVNGEKVLEEYEALMKSGSLSYAMNSGTNKSFGTYCKWSNVDLWIFD